MSETPHLNGHLHEHLNDEQFSALLEGEITDDLFLAQAHLDGCVMCRAEMERVAGAMESFGALTLDWAERRSATLPAVAPQPRAVWMRPVVWAGATAVLALAIVAGVRHESRTAAPEVARVAAPAMMAPAAADAPMAAAPVRPARHLTRAQQIAEDNRMLLAIRHELTRPETLMLPSSEMQGARAARTVND